MATADGASPTEATRRGGWTWVKPFAVGLLVVFALLLAAAVGTLLYFHIPSNAAGLAAKGVCSAAFVAGRDPSSDELMDQDVLPAQPQILGLISTEVDAEAKSVTSRFLGLFSRTAALLPDRGCVLDEEPRPAAEPYAPAPPDPAVWPAGDAALPQGQWPQGIDVEALTSVVDEAMAGSGDPAAANARGVAVVKDGRLLILRDGSDIEPNVALHGWSMTKTVAGMLAYKKFDEVGLSPDTRVVDAFGDPQREPAWVAGWREDDRAGITVADLFFMRAGLELDEGYEPWSQTVQMLYGESDMAQWAAQSPLEFEPGTHWEYLSSISNILADVVRGQFATDEEYWHYWQGSLFDPLGIDSATLETDTSGTWVGSSYLWASAGDWARLGQVMLEDGVWQGEPSLPAGWLAFATTPAVPDGEGHGYGAQSWLPGKVGGECRRYSVPTDTVSMAGHWGQVVAMIPSQRAVIVRLGWTFDSDQFDACRMIADVSRALGD